MRYSFPLFPSVLAALAVMAAPAAAQVGPFAKPGAQQASPLPPELRERKARPAAPAPQPAIVQPRSQASPQLSQCLADAAGDAAAAAAKAQAWLEKASDGQRAEAGQCLGVALARDGRWEESATAFIAARDAADVRNSALRARLGALAGNAALAAGDGDGALGMLDVASADAARAGEAALGGDIAIDRARAMVATGDEAQAEAALAQARAALPGNAQAWLLSATLSRRLGKLPQAQAEIEKAAELAPTDTGVGLEAGVIAMLAGREEAARKSWASVLGAAPPGSDAAVKAQGYLAQIGASAPAKSAGQEKR